MVWTLVDNIRGRDGKDGDKGAKGDTGTISSASAESVPADQPAAVVMSGTDAVKHAHFRIPRGLPSPGAVPADEAVAAYIAALGTASQGALLGLVPVYRLYDTATGTYPPRIPGALNIFLGPVNPGLLMQENDRWENPDLATLAAVTAAMADPSTPLYKATKAVIPQSVAPLSIYPMTSVVGSFGTAQPALIWAVQLAKGGTNGIRFGGRVPDSWGAAKLRYRWLHDNASGSTARINTYYSAAAAAGITGSFTTTTDYTNPRMNLMDMSFTGTPAAGGQYVSGAIVRVSDNPGDTITGPIGIADVWLERIS